MAFPLMRTDYECEKKGDYPLLNRRFGWIIIFKELFGLAANLKPSPISVNENLWVIRPLHCHDDRPKGA